MEAGAIPRTEEYIQSLARFHGVPLGRLFSDPDLPENRPSPTAEALLKLITERDEEISSLKLEISQHHAGSKHYSDARKQIEVILDRTDNEGIEIAMDVLLMREKRNARLAAEERPENCPKEEDDPPPNKEVPRPNLQVIGRKLGTKKEP